MVKVKIFQAANIQALENLINNYLQSFDTTHCSISKMEIKYAINDNIYTAMLFFQIFGY